MQIDRKVYTGGLAGLAGTLLMWGAKRWLGLDIDADLATLIVGAVASTVAYLVPPAEQDLLRHADAAVRGLAPPPAG